MSHDSAVQLIRGRKKIADLASRDSGLRKQVQMFIDGRTDAASDCRLGKFYPVIRLRSDEVAFGMSSTDKLGVYWPVQEIGGYKERSFGVMRSQRLHD